MREHKPGGPEDDPELQVGWALARPAAASCSFNRDQLVSNVVQLNKPRLRGIVFKMKGGRFEYVGAEIFPSFSFGEDGMAQRPGAEATFFGIANLED